MEAHQKHFTGGNEKSLPTMEIITARTNHSHYYARISCDCMDAAILPRFAWIRSEAIPVHFASSFKVFDAPNHRLLVGWV